jgi:hypothetical protein
MNGLCRLNIQSVPIRHLIFGIWHWDGLLLQLQNVVAIMVRIPNPFTAATG